MACNLLLLCSPDAENTGGLKSKGGERNKTSFCPRWIFYEKRTGYMTSEDLGDELYARLEQFREISIYLGEIELPRRAFLFYKNAKGSKGKIMIRM